MSTETIRATSQEEFESIQNIWRGFNILDQMSPSPLHIKWSASPAQTIELDLDSLHDSGRHAGWGFIAVPLGKYAAKNKGVTATIYSYETPSGNWGYLHNAVFFGMAGQKKSAILNIILSAFQSMHGEPGEAGKARSVQARYSPDLISFEKERACFHIEDGKIWRPNDIPETWYNDSSWVP